MVCWRCFESRQLKYGTAEFQDKAHWTWPLPCSEILGSALVLRACQYGLYFWEIQSTFHCTQWSPLGIVKCVCFQLCDSASLSLILMTPADTDALLSACHYVMGNLSWRLHCCVAKQPCYYPIFMDEWLFTLRSYINVPGTNSSWAS